VAALPVGWNVIPPTWQMQDFTTAYFAHPYADTFILLGPQPNYVDWTDYQGQPHREYLAKECIYVWIVPGNFKPKFPAFYEDDQRRTGFSRPTTYAFMATSRTTSLTPTGWTGLLKRRRWYRLQKFTCHGQTGREILQRA